MAKARGKKRRAEHVPSFERKARQHFEGRWRERVSGEVPPYANLKTLMQGAARGVASPSLEFVNHVPPFTSRWRARWQDKTVIIAYDHAMKLPVTCWLDKEAHQ